MVPNEIRKHRSQQMIAMGAEMTKVFIDSQIGKTRPVLFEGEHARGEMCGFTDNYIKVKVQTNQNLVNQLRNVELLQPLGGDEVNGKLKVEN